MNRGKICYMGGLALLITVCFAAAEVDSLFHIYLLFGQSNMAGGCNHTTVAAASIDRQPADCDTTPRIKVLAWGDCTNQQSGPCPSMTFTRKYDEWYTALPPFHKCTEGIGPADYFGKILLDSIRKDITIGFIPCALSGQNIAVYEKGSSAAIDEHTQPYRGSTRLPNNAYQWMVDRCKIAQKSGVIKGILFHQGEANLNESSWPGRVAKIVKDLKTDLGLDDKVPFLAGEVLRSGDAASHNAQVAKVPDVVPNSYVISAEGLDMRVGDSWRLHFSCASVRTFGERYAKKFLEHVDSVWIPRLDDTIPPVSVRKSNFITANSLTSAIGPMTIYSLSGRVVAEINNNSGNFKKYMKSGNLYIISRKVTGANSSVVSVINY